ncbi:MAG: IPT/TIG domain-containing protein [Ignavibacteriales bacterium]
MKNNIYMKNRIKYLVLLFLTLTMYYGCGKDAAPVLYDEYKDKGTPDPVVTSVSPQNVAYAGLDTLTITGSNFSDSAHTIVYFDNVPGTVISSTPTQIRVKVPNLPKDALAIRVVVTTASNNAAPVAYALKEVQTAFFTGFLYMDQPQTITFDKEGNLYISHSTNNAFQGIKKIDVNKNITDYAPKGTSSAWSSLKFAYGAWGGQSGKLLGARKKKGIWKIDQGTAPASTPFIGAPIGVDQNIYDFDFDPSGNLWAAGEGLNIFKVKPDLSQATKYKFANTSSKINAVRVFKDNNTLYVYVGGTKDGKEGVWRYKVVNDEIVAGSEELYFDFAAAYPGINSAGFPFAVLGLTFSKDGYMYIGTDADPAIVVVSPSKTASALLPGVVIPKFASFVWNSYDKVNGQNLVYSRSSMDSEQATEFYAKIFSTKMFKQGAPYYGLEL